MTKNFKIFLIVFILSLPFWWGINSLGENLKNFFFWQEMAQNPRLLAAQANQLAFAQNLRDLKPLRDKKMENLEVKAKSAISVFFDQQGGQRILLEQAVSKRLPLASLSKLMTAYIVLENYDLTKEITISKKAVEQEENLGKLEVGKVLQVKHLLYPLLMESSNDAAFSLANDYDGMSEEKFVALMNLEAQKLGLKDTYFFNVTGLDPENELIEEINYSSTQDLVVLTQTLLKKPLIWQILSTLKLNVYGPELINTNKLLGEVPNIIGGKTGYTEEALNCFLLVLEAPKDKGILIKVILGSAQNRFHEMERLIDWVQQAYQW